MKKKSLFLTLIILLVFLVLAAGGFLLWVTVEDFQPAPKVSLRVQNTSPETPPRDTSRISILNWNIGYAGLGAEQDFFLDGGTRSQPSERDMNRYLKGIRSFLKRHPADIILLQEIDRDSWRTYGTDQTAYLAQALPDHAWVYAPNYQVPFVPVPILNPLGKIDAGLATYSTLPIWNSKRLSLPGEYPWPKRTVHLDRCLIVTRHPGPGDQEWVVIHTHNTAYDSGGTIRQAQLSYIQQVMLEEYQKGHYVVAAGDWNSFIPGYNPANFTCTEEAAEFNLPLPEDFTPDGWKWVIDPQVPTNRSVSAPYRRGESYVTIIDGILVSPNVEIAEQKVYDMDFALTDHHPVYAELKAAGDG